MDLDLLVDIPEPGVLAPVMARAGFLPMDRYGQERVPPSGRVFFLPTHHAGFLHRELPVHMEIHGNQDFKDYEGKAILVVNTASKCGFTPQYKGLEALYKSYKDKGLVVLGFPCDQFAHQEPGDDAAIAQFCEWNFGVTFPLMAKVNVNGADAHPVFKLLKKQAPGAIGGSIKWNFTKFLVSPDGRTVKRYAPSVEPEAIEADIVAALQQ